MRGPRVDPEPSRVVYPFRGPMLAIRQIRKRSGPPRRVKARPRVASVLPLATFRLGRDTNVDDFALRLQTLANRDRQDSVPGIGKDVVAVGIFR